MYYTIYKITNTVNGKIYIGKHQTKNLEDGYLGSGKLLKRAITKHGQENFKKEIVELMDSEESMNQLEAFLVTEEFCSRNDTYNICSGGRGGFSYINKNILTFEDRSRRGKNGIKITHQKLTSQKRSSILNNSYEKGIRPRAYLGKRNEFHTEETKQKISIALKEKQKGILNSQYGTAWITDGIKNRKIKNDLTIPDGWYKGRVSDG